MSRYLLFLLIGCLGTVSLIEIDPQQGDESRSTQSGRTVDSDLGTQDVEESVASALLLDITQDRKQTIDLLLDITNASPQRATMLGVHVRRPNSTLRSHLRIDDGMGLVVEHVVPGSAAADAGLEVNDVILQIDEQALVNQEQLTTLIRNRTPGDVVDVVLFRRGKRESTQVTLKEGNIDAMEIVDPQHSHWLLDAHPRVHLDANLNMSDFRNCKACHVAPNQSVKD